MLIKTPRYMLLAAIGAAALSACATPETRIRNGLVEAGLPKPLAECMAGRMSDQLSMGQLYKLSKTKKLDGKKVQQLSIAEFLERTKALQDPEILKIVTSAGIRCALKF